MDQPTWVVPDISATPNPSSTSDSEDESEICGGGYCGGGSVYPFSIRDLEILDWICYFSLFSSSSSLPARGHCERSESNSLTWQAVRRLS